MIQFRLFLSLFLLGIVLTGCGLINSNSRGKAIDLKPETVAEISFDTIQNLMIVEAEINGQKGKFLFDNGFTLSAISPDFAEKAGINFNQSARVNDINNKKSTLEETTIASVKIGDIEFRKTGFYKIDTKKFFPCNEVDGVIGGSIINKVNWKVLYRDRRIEISRKPFDVSANSYNLDIEFNGGNSALTEITIQEAEITCKVDIGMSAEMSIHAKYVELFEGMEAVNNVGIGSLSGSGLGNSENNYDLTERVVFASSQSQLPIGAELELDESQKYNGYIGVGYLKHYNFILNSTEKQYVLSEPIVPNETKAENYGIVLYMIDDTCRIIQKNGFDPLLNGVPLMQAVSMIDNVKTNDFKSVCDLRDYLRKKNREKTEMVLQFYNNEEPLVLPYREVVVGKIE
ncbi:MAG: hypothetical protein Crog4KO_26650 [Crocinitomicaceae bacterium]